MDFYRICFQTYIYINMDYCKYLKIRTEAYTKLDELQNLSETPQPQNPSDDSDKTPETSCNYEDDINESFGNNFVLFDISDYKEMVEKPFEFRIKKFVSLSGKDYEFIKKINKIRNNLIEMNYNRELITAGLQEIKNSYYNELLSLLNEKGEQEPTILNNINYINNSIKDRNIDLKLLDHVVNNLIMLYRFYYMIIPSSQTNSTEISDSTISTHDKFKSVLEIFHKMINKLVEFDTFQRKKRQQISDEFTVINSISDCSVENDEYISTYNEINTNKKYINPKNASTFSKSGLNSRNKK